MSTGQEEALRNALVSLARINEEGQFTRRPVRWSDLPENVHDALERFVQARLLISRGEGKERVLEVAHEALFHSWGRLNRWLDKDREFLLWRKRFKDLHQEWLRTNHDPGSLLVGRILNEGQNWLQYRANLFNSEESEYLRTSIRRAKTIIKFKLVSIAATVVFLIGIAIVGFTLASRAREAQENAEKQRDISEKQTELVRRGAYNFQLTRARGLWQRDPLQALFLLNDINVANIDLRDFTWRFLYRICLLIGRN